MLDTENTSGIVGKHPSSGESQYPQFRMSKDSILETREYRDGAWNPKEKIYRTAFPGDITLEQKLVNIPGLKDAIVIERYTKLVTDAKGAVHTVEMVQTKDGTFREANIVDRALSTLSSLHRTGRVIETLKPGGESQFTLQVEVHSVHQIPHLPPLKPVVLT